MVNRIACGCAKFELNVEFVDEYNRYLDKNGRDKYAKMKDKFGVTWLQHTWT